MLLKNRRLNTSRQYALPVCTFNKDRLPSLLLSAIGLCAIASTTNAMAVNNDAANVSANLSSNPSVNEDNGANNDDTLPAAEDSLNTETGLTIEKEETLKQPNANNAKIARTVPDATPTITEIAEGLDKKSYQTYPLQSIVDPITGVTIDDTYQIEVPEKITLRHAQHVLTQVSPKLASNQAAIAASELQSQATEGLNKPWVFLRAGATHYDLDADVDLTEFKSSASNSIRQGLIDASTGLPIPISSSIINGLPPIITSRIPDTYNLKREDTRINTGVAMLWPVYTAGRTDAITSLTEAQTDESQADALIDNDELQKTLIERYFDAQLAQIVSYLREDALNTVAETDYMAQRLLEEGFISEVERLEAKVALSEAKSESLQARHNAQLAMTALQRLLRTPKPVKPVTPIFVSSNPLPSLDYFQQVAIENHPSLKKVDAKYSQAESLSLLANVENKPTVSLFGYHEIDTDPSWIAGISASWKLWGGLDARAQYASGQAKMRQALLAKVDASDNILLLVEKNWQEVENARIQFFSLNSNVQLAEELLRYKQLGLREGVNTALDVTTAQTKYLKARTEQVAAANDYVQALAALMESCGTPEAFNDYMAQADIKLPVLY